MGEGISYNHTRILTEDKKVAPIPVGYGDGYPRLLSNCGYVLIRGKKAPILGRICMDQTLVDATEIPETAPGDEAVLIGNSGAEKITACDVAEAAGTISNEILSRLGARLERIAVAPESDQNTAAVNNSTARAMRQACF